MEYNADVRFTVYGINAETWLIAMDKVDELISQLASVKTELHWDNVHWDLGITS